MTTFALPHDRARQNLFGRPPTEGAITSDRRRTQSQITSRTGTTTVYDDTALDRQNVISSDAWVVDEELARLQLAAATGNERAFTQLCHAIIWSNRTAEDFLYVTQLALQAGAHFTARELSRNGTARFPQDVQLAHLAHVLAPPRVLGTTPAKPEEVQMHRRNVEWLRINGSAHIGKWVALRNGELLAEGDLARDVVARLGKVPRQSVLLTQIA